jgi:hypothetical protein
MALQADITLNVVTALTKALDLGVSPEARMGLKKLISLVSGVGADQADRIFTDERTLAASASEDLDLAGALVDPLGDPAVFARIKALIVIAEPLGGAPANTNNVVIGGALSNAWVGPFGAAAHTVALQPGNAFIATAKGATAWPVTAGTGDLLRITNSAGTTGVTYQIALIGASA